MASLQDSEKQRNVFIFTKSTPNKLITIEFLRIDKLMLTSTCPISLVIKSSIPTQLFFQRLKTHQAHGKAVASIVKIKTEKR